VGYLYRKKCVAQNKPVPLGKRVTGWEQVETQVLETMTLMGATVMCVREYGCVTG
jgi:hypothetical protein